MVIVTSRASMLQPGVSQTVDDILLLKANIRTFKLGTDLISSNRKRNKVGGNEIKKRK